MSFYDKQQAIEDIERILSFYGRRVQRGFFTVGEYEDENVKIVQHLNYNFEIYWRGEKVPLGKIAMDSGLGQWLLRMAVKCDDIVVRWLPVEIWH